MPETTRKQRRTRTTRRRTAIWWSIAGVFVLLVAGVAVVAALIVPKALNAGDLLKSSIPLVSQIQADVVAGDTEKATAQAAELTKRTAEARAETSGPVWRALEWVPFAGQNLSAVRLAAEATDELATGAVTPVAGLSLASLTPADGAINIEAVNGIVTTVDGIGSTLAHATSLIAGIDRDALIGPVASGVVQLDGALAKATETFDAAEPVVRALPEMLGADGPRDVLILFQNNGEVMPGGGTIGSLAQLHIDNGAIEMVEQSSAAYEYFPPAESPVVEIPTDARSIYGTLLGRYVQSLTRTPRFDLTFEIAREMWERKTGTTVDAVVALDVVALGQLLKATGPISLPNDLTLTADNAIPLLLGDLYYDYDHLEVDAINQAFAAATVAKLFAGSVSIPALMEVLATAMDEGRIRAWSSRESEQHLIAGSSLDRRGPTTNATETELGVYFMDATPGKMQRFMTQAVSITNTVCGAERQVRAAVTLRNTVAGDAVPDLPDYITGYGRKTPKGTIRVSTIVYAPPGFTPTTADPGGPVEIEKVVTDGDYSVVQMQVLLEPGASRALTFDYSLSRSDVTVGADVTPVVTATEIQAAPACAG